MMAALAISGALPWPVNITLLGHFGLISGHVTVKFFSHRKFLAKSQKRYHFSVSGSSQEFARNETLPMPCPGHFRRPEIWPCL